MYFCMKSFCQFAQDENFFNNEKFVDYGSYTFNIIMFVLLHTPCSHEGYIPSSYVKRVSKQLHKAAQPDPSNNILKMKYC